jgi:hypothetical protein
MDCQQAPAFGVHVQDILLFTSEHRRIPHDLLKHVHPTREKFIQNLFSESILSPDPTTSRANIISS